MLSKIYMFPAIITKFAEDDFNVRFPDIEEINTFGSTFEEAYDMAEDALNLYIFDLYSDEIEVPCAKEFFLNLEENQTLIVIKSDLNKIIKMHDNKAIKKTLTIPSWLNKEAEKSHINFSQVLQKALIEHLHIDA